MQTRLYAGAAGTFRGAPTPMWCWCAGQEVGMQNVSESQQKQSTGKGQTCTAVKETLRPSSNIVETEGVIDSVCSRDWRQPMEHWVRARGKRQQPMESAMGQNTKKSTVGCWLLIMACKWLQMIVNVRGSQNANLQILTSNGDGGVYIVCILYCNDAHYAVNFQIHKVVCHLRRPAEPPKTNAAICAQHPRLQAIHKAATGATMHMWCTSSIAAWCWCSHHETWHCTCTGYWSARHFVLRSHCKNLISTRSGELFPQLQL